MSTATTTTNTAQTELKNSKKKRSKAGSTAAAAEPSSTPPPSTPGLSEPTTNGTGPDFPFLKDLQRSLRNVTKKLNSTAKVDAIVAENPGKSADELVAEKKINNDQKAQIEKKPALQASVSQIEEQISQFKQYGAYYEDRLAKQKEELEKAHKEELEAAREQAAEAVKLDENALRQRLLVFTRFLRAAAAMRSSGDESSNDRRAYEGALLQVYGGTDEAVSAMMKLIDGTEDPVPSTDGEPLGVTYQRIKQTSVEYTPDGPEATYTDDPEGVEAASTADAPQATDPTVASAGMTELQDPTIADQAATSNGVPSAPPPAYEEQPPNQAMVDEKAANPLAQADWEHQAPASLSTSTTAEGWVDIQRPENGHNAAPTTTTTADATVPSTNGQNGGFEQVVHHSRQGSGRGRGFRGRGGPRGDGSRGRGGPRGDFRGRGRGRGGEFRGRGRGGYGGQGGGSGPGTPPTQ